MPISSRKIMYEGKEYASLGDLAKSLGMSRQSLSNKIARGTIVVYDIKDK